MKRNAYKIDKTGKTKTKNSWKTEKRNEFEIYQKDTPRLAKEPPEAATENYTD